MTETIVKGGAAVISMLAPARNTRAVERPDVCPTPALFPDVAARIAQCVRALAPWELESLLDVDEKRALALFDAYQRFDPRAPGAPALLAYWGAAYRNLDAMDFTADDFAFAQDHLRLLSALYGLLRPLDSVLPHRLGLRGLRAEGQDLYSLWGRRIRDKLFETGEPVVNLASVDYAQLVVPHLLPGDALIGCRFQVQRPGGARGTVATIRAARGQMARFLIKNRVDRPDGLKDFDWAGYRFVPGGSSERDYLFIQMR